MHSATDLFVLSFKNIFLDLFLNLVRQSKQKYVVTMKATDNVFHKSTRGV